MFSLKLRKYSRQNVGREVETSACASVDMLIDVFRYATRITRVTKLMCVVLFYFVVILHLNSL